MGTLLVWLIIGAIAGAVASAVVPGRTPGGRLGALAVGIGGGLLGGLVLDVLGVDSDYSWIGSLVVAILGALVILTVLGKRNQGGRD